MDLEYSLQDLVRCYRCETPLPSLHCVTCHVHLCKACAGEHISDKSFTASIDHRVVLFTKREFTFTYPECIKHSSKHCELYCENCDTNICVQCISSEEHRFHRITDIVQWFKGKKKEVFKDFPTLEKCIRPKHNTFVSSFPLQEPDSLQLATDLYRLEETLKREIDNINKNLESDLDEVFSKQLASSQRQKHDNKSILTEISNPKRLPSVNDINIIIEYKYSLLALSTNTQRDCILKFFKTESSPSVIFAADKSKNIQTIQTDYGVSNKLRSVSVLNDEHIWTCGRDNCLRLYNLQGKEVSSFKTTSENTPSDIEVTRSGDLVYTDYNDSSINIIQNTNIHAFGVIKLRGWKPLNVCCAFSGDLLVFFEKDDSRQSKLVRYSGFEVKQSIEFNDEGQPLFSHGDIKYVSENRNLDICVSDWRAGAIVVVNQAGKLRFTYTGAPSTTKGSFDPHGITTDSQSRILIADSFNHCVHIIDSDGEFIFFICNCGLECPIDLSIDAMDNIFVAERFTGKIKKMQLCM